MRMGWEGHRPSIDMGDSNSKVHFLTSDLLSGSELIVIRHCIQTDGSFVCALLR